METDRNEKHCDCCCCCCVQPLLCLVYPVRTSARPRSQFLFPRQVRTVSVSIPRDITDRKSVHSSKKKKNKTARTNNSSIEEIRHLGKYFHINSTLPVPPTPLLFAPDMQNQPPSFTTERATSGKSERLLASTSHWFCSLLLPSSRSPEAVVAKAGELLAQLVTDADHLTGTDRPPQPPRATKRRGKQ